MCTACESDIGPYQLELEAPVWVVLVLVPSSSWGWPRASFTHFGATYACFLYLSISFRISCWYSATASSESIPSLTSICIGCVFLPESLHTGCPSNVAAEPEVPIFFGDFLACDSFTGIVCARWWLLDPFWIWYRAPGDLWFIWPRLVVICWPVLKSCPVCSMSDQIHCHLTISAPWIYLASLAKSSQ